MGGERVKTHNTTLVAVEALICEIHLRNTQRDVDRTEKDRGLHKGEVGASEFGVCE